MASAAFVVLFPVGAVGMRVVSFEGLVWVHAAYMMGVYLVGFAALGMGIVSCLFLVLFVLRMC